MASDAVAEIPYFDLTDPQFAVASPAVIEARELSWYARTNVGLAVLAPRARRAPCSRIGACGRAATVAAAERDRGRTADEWWAEMLLSQEGDEPPAPAQAGQSDLLTAGDRRARARGFRSSLTASSTSSSSAASASSFPSSPSRTRRASYRGLFGLPDDSWRTSRAGRPRSTLPSASICAEDLATIESGLASMYARVRAS